MSKFNKQNLIELINDLMGREIDKPLPLLINKQITDLIVDHNLTLLEIGKVLAYAVDIEQVKITEKYGIKPIVIYTRERAKEWYNKQEKEQQRQKLEARKISDNNIVFKIRPHKQERKIIQLSMDDFDLGDDKNEADK